MSPANDLDQALARTFVVVPAYNEEKVIGDVVTALHAVFANVVVVNDGSSDNTLGVLRDLQVHVVTHAVNLGQGAAIQTGITYGAEQGAEYFITFDADGQHRIEDALTALREVQTGGCDVACGSRFLGTAVNIPLARKLILKAAILFSNLTSKVKLTDAHNGLRAFSRKAALCLDISQSGMAHASEINSLFARHEMLIHEVPVQINYTEYSLAKGQSSMNAINILIDLFVGRFLK